MSSATLRALMALGCVLAMGSGASSGRAQEADLRSALLQHLDTLYPLVAEAAQARDRALAEADSLARVRPAVPQDTVRVGLLTVVTYPAQAELAREVLGAIWSDLEEKVARSQALEEIVFSFNWSRETRPLTLLGRSYEISASFWQPRSMLESNAREAIGAALGQDLGGKVGTWTAQWNVRAPRRPEEVYRELATTSSQANRACLAGDPRSCWHALGLGLSDTGAYRTLYSPEEAAAVVSALHTEWTRQGWWYRPGDDAHSGQRCVDGSPLGSYEDCWTFIEHYRSRIPTPLGFGPRQAMAWIALERGGAGSFDRLLADPERSPEEALLAASGLTRDELAVAWREWVLSHRPEVYSGLGGTRWLALFWFVFFGLLAMRSKRWRLQ